MKIKQRLGPSFRPGIPAAIVAITALACASGMAADRTWVASGSNNADWSTKQNWDGPSGGQLPIENDHLFFGGTVRPTNNNNLGVTNYLGITFNDEAGSFILNGNSITLGTLGVTNNSTNNQTINLPLTLNADRNFNSNSGNMVINGVIDGSGGLTKIGVQTLTLSNTNTYTGDTNINAGTLLLSGSLDAASTVNVNNGGTLAGGGAANGTLIVNNGGTVAPGNGGIDVLHAGNTTFNSGSIFSWDLNVADPSSTTSDTTYDQLTGLTDSTLSGDGGTGAILNVVGQDFSAAFWSVDQVWTNIFSGFEPGFNLADIFSGGVTSDVSPSRGFFTVSGTDLNYTALPEPTTALAGMLLAAGILRRRRK